MNFICPDSSKIQLALQTHVEKLKPLLIDRISTIPPIYQMFFNAFLIEEIDGILKLKPQELLGKYYSLSNVLHLPGIKEQIEYVFNYETWFATKSKNIYRAYDLAEALEINTCLYCNRLYTKTVIKSKSKITRPQFDHWFPKEKYPLLALSFFNLIPSCGICNSTIKGREEMALDTHLHPYIPEPINMKFSFQFDKDIVTKFWVKDNGSQKVRRTIDFFKIQEIYETHVDEINDLFLMRKKYSINYMDHLRNLIKDPSFTDDEIYRLAFGTHKKEEEFEKRPLSRMKRDLLKELGII